MEVHILFECFDQRDFIDSDRFTSADPAREVVGVYSNILKANEEKERLEAVIDPDDEVDVPCYEIESHEVK